MKVLQIYNQYRSLFGGEENMVFSTASIIERHGGDSRLLMRSSRGLENGLRTKARAFFNGIYSRSAYREVSQYLQEDLPDVVHSHNVYPLFSPSVFVACRRAGVPVVCSLHNHMLTCPSFDHIYRGEICEKCNGGSEYHCVLRNCQQSIPKSIGYALRSAVVRKMRLFQDNVTILIALTEFAKRRLVRIGYSDDRIVVLPNPVTLRHDPTDPARGKYAAFAGRMSSEKGANTLLNAAAKTPEAAVRFAGGGPILAELQARAPESVQFPGQLDSDQMANFYRNARFLVLPSQCFEGCPLVILEAMSHGLPVVASRIGGLAELVEEGVTGLLFEPGNSEELAEKLRLLWNDPDLCRRMGQAGRAKAEREYGEDDYFNKLSSIYERAIRLASGDGRRRKQRNAGPSGSHVMNGREELAVSGK